jgi:hypothetical protein
MFHYMPSLSESWNVVIVRNNNDRSFSMEVMKSVATPTFTTNF